MRNSVSFDICDQAHIYWEVKDYTQTWTQPLSQGNLHMTKWTHLPSAWRTPGKYTQSQPGTEPLPNVSMERVGGLKGKLETVLHRL